MLCLCWMCIHAQSTNTKGKGRFQLGLRGTTSLFSETNEPGYGFGGQFRILFAPRVNSEWYSDIIFTDLYGLGTRNDYHIGWSVMYYLIDTKDFQRKFTPYVLGGHCFDYSVIKINDEPNEKFDRLSTAIQLGAGLHYNITPSIDLSLTTQYMLHIGKELHVENENGRLVVENHEHNAWEGHLLITFSTNFKINGLWKRKS